MAAQCGWIGICKIALVIIAKAIHPQATERTLNETLSPGFSLFALVACFLIVGGLGLANTPNADPFKFFSLKMHMSIGTAILALMVGRLLVRLFTKKPPHANIGNDLLNKGAIAAHYFCMLL